MKSNRNVLNGLLIFGGLVLVLSLLHAQELVTKTVQPASIKPLPLTATDIHEFSTYSDKELAAVLGLLVQTPAIAPEDLPSGGNFQSLQHPDWPFLPGNVRNVPAWKISGPDARAGYYLLDDLDFDETAVKAARGKAFGLAEFDSEDGGGMMSYARVYATNELWLEIRWEDLTNQIAHLTAHNTIDGSYYQILTKTNLTQPEWDLANLFTGASGTNQTDIDDVPTGTNDVMFFRAEQSDVRVYIEPEQDAVEASSGVPGTNGIFYVYAEGSGSSVTVYYRVSIDRSTAIEGTDFTNLSGSVSVPVGGRTAIDFYPVPDNAVEGIESVVVTLIQTNSYLIHPEAAAATNYIWDSSTTVSLTTTTNLSVEPDGPPGVPAQVGSFTVSRSDFRGLDTNLDVYYQISGTASNGVDFTFLNGVVHFAAGIDATNLFVTPLADTVLEGMETVTVSLLPTNSYVIDTNNQTGTVTIMDTSTTVSIHAGDAATEPNPASTTPGQTGYFEVDRTDTRTGNTNSLTVYYQVSGLASNGVDYTNLPANITFAPGNDYALIYVQAIADNLIEGEESVILTLLTTNGYYLDAHFADTNVIHDNLATNTFQTVATDLDGPIGIDWQPTINSLVVSLHSKSSGNPNNFARLYTNTVPSNATIVTNWTGVAGIPEEVKLATVKADVGGFTNGDTYFGSDAAVGWISANGSLTNLKWCVLTNYTVTNALTIRGGLYVDQTGVFSNNLIVATSDDSGNIGNKGVWRVDAQAHPTLLASIVTKHLEGVVALPNNVVTWGPWAGKIITGDEDKDPPLIYTIATNGNVTTNDTSLLTPDGIHPEDFDIIPANQDLYACDYVSDSVVKVSANYFTNYVGDLLITDAGEVTGEGRLFIVHWDNKTTNFVTRKISYKRADGTTGLFEHVTFAPINLPPQ